VLHSRIVMMVELAGRESARAHIRERREIGVRWTRCATALPRCLGLLDYNERGIDETDGETE
jgi:hypothetical protein